MSKLVDEKTHGIIINITKGLITPPVKNNKKLNWNISIFKKKKENLLLREFFL